MAVRIRKILLEPLSTVSTSPPAEQLGKFSDKLFDLAYESSKKYHEAGVAYYRWHITTAQKTAEEGEEGANPTLLIPDLIMFDNPTAALAATGNQQNDKRSSLVDSREQIRFEIIAFGGDKFNSIGRLAPLSCNQLLDHLHEAYGTITEPQVEVLRQQRSAAIGQDFEGCIAKATAAHNILVSINRGGSEADFFAAVVAGIRKGAVINRQADAFILQHHTPEARTVRALAAFLREVVPALTVGELGYAETARPVVAAAPGMITMEQCQAMINAAIAADRADRAPMQTGPFCFRHHYSCGYLGKDCPFLKTHRLATPAMRSATKPCIIDGYESGKYLKKLSN